jgi:hypothetical protein
LVPRHFQSPTKRRRHYCRYSAAKPFLGQRKTPNSPGISGQITLWRMSFVRIQSRQTPQQGPPWQNSVVIPATKPRCSKIFHSRATIAGARITTDKACLAQTGAAAAFPSRRPHLFQYSRNLRPDAEKFLGFWKHDPTCHSRKFFKKIPKYS